MKRRSLALAGVFVLLAGGLVVPVASARGRPSCLVSNDRTGLGSRSLQHGIDAAAPGDTLVVKGTCVGISAITKDLTFKGVSNPVFGEATLDGAGLGRVLTIASGVTVAISDLAITNGTATEGGGIYNNSYGAVTLTDSDVSGNTAAYAGGGIYNNPNGMIILSDSTVGDNTTTYVSGAGGGIFNYYGTVTLTDSDVSGNNAPSGGGIANYYGTVTLTDSDVSGNSGISGGGILNSNDATFTFTSSILSGNTASEGGGVFNFGTLTITDSTVSSNTAIYGGAGIFSYTTWSSVTVTDSAVSGNTASVGGGIANYFGGSVLLANSTVSGNTATVLGGGVFAFGGGAITLTGTSTISDNTPDNCFPPGTVAGCTG